MRVVKIVVCAVLLAAGVGALAADAGSAPRKPKPAVKCAVWAKLAGGVVTASTNCRLQKRRLASQLRWTYTETDAEGNICGAPVSGSGANIQLKYPQAYTAQFSFRAQVRLNGKTVAKNLPVTGLDVDPNPLAMMCGKSLPPSAVQNQHTACKVVFNLNLDVNSPDYSPNYCGLLQQVGAGGATLISPQDTRLYPYITAWPSYDQASNTVSVPWFASPSGLCVEQNQSDASAVIFGQSYQSKEWDCADGTKVVFTWYLYLAPDAKAGASQQPYPSCRAGLFGPPTGSDSLPTGYLPLGGFVDHLTLPTAWSGRVFAEAEMRWLSPDGRFIDEYSDTQWFQNGTVNGCPELSALKG